MVLGVRFGGSGTNNRKNPGIKNDVENGVLVVRKPPEKVYRGLKGFGKTVSGVKIFWFEISEYNGEFRNFLEDPVSWFNTTISPIVAGVVDETKLKEEEITGISARLNVKASAVEVRTTENRFIFYVFSSGEMKLIKADIKPKNGLPQLLQDSEVIREYSELPVDEKNAEKFKIREVRGI